MGALISFLGGSVFRMLWGEISAAWNAAADHRQEIERMKLQGELDAAAHARNLEAITVQAGLGVKVIEAQAVANIDALSTEIWGRAVDMTGSKTGYSIIDIFNGVIRPLLATECMVLMALHLNRQNWLLDANAWELIGAALGIYVADRSLFKRGK